MQANKDYFIMINNEAEYNQAVKMLKNMGFKLLSSNIYDEDVSIVCTYNKKEIVRMGDSRETYKKEFPEDVELFLNNESKEMISTKHNIDIADHPELQDVIVLTRTQQEWDDVIQYDPYHNKIISSSFNYHQENSAIFCRKHSFTFSNLDGIKMAENQLRVMYYSQWKALLERIAAEQKENDKYLFANKELKQFKDLSDNEKLIVVNAVIADYRKLEYTSHFRDWYEKFDQYLHPEGIYRVLK